MPESTPTTTTEPSMSSGFGTTEPSPPAA
jgi:hypothetical protein